jgi:spoIIIJ-associated protein
VGDAARAREVLGEILKRMGIEATIELREEAERSVLDIKGPEAGLVIGKKGMTLDSLQYLIGKIIHRGEPAPESEGAPGRRTIIVDAEGYRTRREASLVELAHRLGEKAIRTNKTITVNPMSPHDRRIIHITLDKVPGVTTRSEGEGVFRRLLIVPQPDKV